MVFGRFLTFLTTPQFCVFDRAPLAFTTFLVLTTFRFGPLFVWTTFRLDQLFTQDIAPPDNSSDSSGSSSEAEEEEDEVFPDFDQMGDDVVGEAPMDNDAFPDFGEQPEDADTGIDDGGGFGDDDWGSGGGGFGEETTSEGDAGFGGSFGNDDAFPDF